VLQGKLRIDLPGRLMVRWPTARFCDYVALSTHGTHLKRNAGTQSIALLFHPMFWPYVRHLDPRLIVYYACDAYRLIPGWTDELERHERELVARADLIIAYSQGMLDCMPAEAGRRGEVLSTGVDIEPFGRDTMAAVPPDLARIPPPRIGYVGRINQKLDYELVYEVARRRPQWNWVFIGGVGAHPDGRFAADREAEASWTRCRNLPNIHVLGAKPHADVPVYLQNMDVNVMCYRTDGIGWWSEIFPLKSMEYLAAGKPIVSSPVKSMLSFADNLAIAATPQQWVNAIEHALDAGGIGTPATRAAIAGANTWDRKIDRLAQRLVDALENR
jgi:glycosyltransferase involved in cell wall biosynthesis